MFLSFVFFITALLGFLTFTVVVTQFKTNRKANAYLLILIFFASFRFFLNGVHALIPILIDERVVIIFRSFGCVIFPCIYLYFSSLVVNKKHIAKEDLRHFIIPILFGFTNLLIREYAISLHFYSYFLFSGIALFYLFLSYVELKNKVWFRSSKRSFVEMEKVLIRNWTIFFFSICVLSITRLIVTLFLDIYVAGFSEGTGHLWIAAILSCVLFFKILLTPEVLYADFSLVAKVKSKECFELVFSDFWILSDDISINNVEDLRLKEKFDQNLMVYIHKVERMALYHFCFRNPSVSLGDFAIKLGIPKNYLIYFFKYHATINFVEFKKTVQIYDAINLMEENYLESNSLALLSKKVGFSSYDLFFDSFKEITGVLPKEYNKLIKEL